MIDEEEFDEIDTILCNACESEYAVVLAEDLLEVKISFCPFCCEPVIDQPMLFVGIDYSLTGPAICLYNTEDGEFSFANTKCHFLASKKMHEAYNDGVIVSTNYPKKWTTYEGRYSALAFWAEQQIFNALGSRANDQLTVYIEGYAFGASGKVFHIAENTAILKHMLYKAGVSYETVAPTEVKKFATGKGNSNKDVMFEHFLEETGVDLMSSLSPKASKVNSPVSDIVDAYYICKLGIMKSSLRDDGATLQHQIMNLVSAFFSADYIFIQSETTQKTLANLSIV